MKKLAKVLAYQKHFVDKKGLTPSNIMVQHDAQTSSPSPPVKTAGQEESSTFKCDQFNKIFKSKQKLESHTKNQHTELHKPETIVGEEAETSFIL